MPCSQIERLKIVKMPIHCKLIYFDPHDNPSRFYVETDKLILKIILEMQKPGNSKEIKPKEDCQK